MKLAAKFLLAVTILVVYDILLDGLGLEIKERWNRFTVWIEEAKKKI